MLVRRIGVGCLSDGEQVEVSFLVVADQEVVWRVAFVVLGCCLFLIELEQLISDHEFFEGSLV